MFSVAHVGMVQGNGFFGGVPGTTAGTHRGVLSDSGKVSPGKVTARSEGGTERAAPGRQLPEVLVRLPCVS